MQTLTATQLAHLKRGGHIGYVLQIYPLQGATVDLTEENIIEDSLTLERGAWSTSNALQIGNADAAELIFTLDNSDGQWDALNLAGSEIWFEWDINSEQLPGGSFIIDKVERGYDSIRVYSLDYMKTFDEEYDGGILFPATLRQILTYCINKSWCYLDNNLEFVNSDYIVDKAPDRNGLTYWQLVKWVAQLAGCNAWVDHEGYLRLSWFGDDSHELNVDDDMMTQWVIYDESPKTITGVQYVDFDKSYVAGGLELPISFTGNELLQDNHQAVVNAIHAKVGGKTFLPVSSLPTVFLPNVWPGDTLHITSLNQDVLVSKHHLSTLSDMGCGGERELVTLSNLAQAERTEIKELISNTPIGRLSIDTFINQLSITYSSSSVIGEASARLIVGLDASRALVIYQNKTWDEHLIYARVARLVDGAIVLGLITTLTTLYNTEVAGFNNIRAVAMNPNTVVMVYTQAYADSPLQYINGVLISVSETDLVTLSDSYTSMNAQTTGGEETVLVENVALCQINANTFVLKNDRLLDTDVRDVVIADFKIGLVGDHYEFTGQNEINRMIAGPYPVPPRSGSSTLIALDSAKSLLMYGFGTSTVSMRVLNNSTLEFTPYIYTRTAPDSITGMTAITVSPATFMFAYSTATVTRIGTASIPDGTFMAFSTELTTDTINASQLILKQLDATHFLFGYSYESAGQIVHCCRVITNGALITAGPEFQYAVSSTDIADVEPLTASAALIAFDSGAEALVRPANIDLVGSSVKINGGDNGLGIVIDDEQIFGFTSDDIYMRSPGADNHRLGCDSTGPYYMIDGIKTYLGG